MTNQGYGTAAELQKALRDQQKETPFATPHTSYPSTHSGRWATCTAAHNVWHQPSCEPWARAAHGTHPVAIKQQQVPVHPTMGTKQRRKRHSPRVSLVIMTHALWLHQKNCRQRLLGEQQYPAAAAVFSSTRCSAYEAPPRTSNCLIGCKHLPAGHKTHSSRDTGGHHLMPCTLLS
jgi:hypothetical protein